VTKGPPPWTLLAGTLAVALGWWTRPPPGPVPETPEEVAAVQRAAVLAGAQARTWQQEEGDLVIPWQQAQGHLAIVIDDAGRELLHFERLAAMRHRLTFSVLPGAVYAAGVALRLTDERRRPRNVMLHLPMEPDDPTKMNEGLESTEVFLRRSDAPADIRRKVEAALARVPDAIAVNNHMGSAFTRDAAAMAVVAQVLAERGVAFVDSRTIAESVAGEATRKAGVPTLVREVFLDHDADPAAIERELDRAAELSRDHPVIAIGHPGPALVEVLERRLPQLHAEGIGVYPIEQFLAVTAAATGPS
jgi:uncharacterized protein